MLIIPETMHYTCSCAHVLKGTQRLGRAVGRGAADFAVVPHWTRDNKNGSAHLSCIARFALPSLGTSLFYPIGKDASRRSYAPRLPNLPKCAGIHRNWMLLLVRSSASSKDEDKRGKYNKTYTGVLKNGSKCERNCFLSCSSLPFYFYFSFSSF